MAFSVGPEPDSDPNVSSIIICTPSGMKLVTLVSDGEAGGDHGEGILCALCLAAADIAVSPVVPDRVAVTCFQKYAQPVRPTEHATAAIAINPARAPPV